MSEIAEVIKYCRDAGLLPYAWVVVLVVILNRFPKMRVALFDVLGAAFFVPLKETAKRKTDSPANTEYIHRHNVVMKDDCHTAMNKIDIELNIMNDKINAVSGGLENLRGYLEGKLGK